MDSDSSAHLQISQGLACLTLARPDRGNALSDSLVQTLTEAVTRACADPSVHTLALSALGAHFCTGFDLGDLETQSDGDLLLRFVRIEMLLDAVWRAPVRTVALASGRTWGAGADLFAACDLRLACADTTFRFPGAGFGLVLGTRRLSERVGSDQARAWVSDARTLDAQTALAAGLAHQLIEPLPAEAALRAPAIAQRCGPGPSLDRDTLLAVRRAGRNGGGPGGDALADTDLAALVRSAAREGLQSRILEYRARSRPAK
jgi:enoyl-CoA hydratase/carnithine racemase